MTRIYSFSANSSLRRACRTPCSVASLMHVERSLRLSRGDGHRAFPPRNECLEVECIVQETISSRRVCHRPHFVLILY